MKIKTTLAVIALMLAPGMASAYCSGDKSLRSFDHQLVGGRQAGVNPGLQRFLDEESMRTRCRKTWCHWPGLSPSVGQFSSLPCLAGS